MAGRLSRGWSMAKASFGILKQYPRLAILPAISGTILLSVVGLVVLSFFPQSGPLHTSTRGLMQWFGGAGYAWFFVALFGLIYLLTVVAVFANAALIHCAMQCHGGHTPSIRAGLGAAASRFPQILGWALIAATVGVALNALQAALKELGFLGDLLVGVLELVWAGATYFVLPVLVMENVGPITALRRSGSILRAKWGESFAGEARFGLFGLLFLLQAAGLFFIGLALVRSFGAGAYAGAGPLLMAAGILYAIATAVVLQTLSTLFQTGVYVYASTDQAPASMDRQLVESAFRPKK